MAAVDAAHLFGRAAADETDDAVHAREPDRLGLQGIELTLGIGVPHLQRPACKGVGKVLFIELRQRQADPLLGVLAGAVGPAQVGGVPQENRRRGRSAEATRRRRGQQDQQGDTLPHPHGQSPAASIG